MKYLFFAALIISLFAVSCDEDKAVLKTEADTALTVHDESEIKNILSGISNNSRIPNNMVGRFYDWEQDPFDFLDHNGRPGDCPGGSSGPPPCGFCPGFCLDAYPDLTADPHSGPLSTADYNAGLRIYKLGILKHKQTGDKKIFFNTRYINDFFDNGFLVLDTDLHLSSRITARLNSSNLTIKAGRYALVIDQTTGHGQTVIDLQ